MRSVGKINKCSYFKAKIVIHYLCKVPRLVNKKLVSF